VEHLAGFFSLEFLVWIDGVGLGMVGGFPEFVGHSFVGWALSVKD